MNTQRTIIATAVVGLLGIVPSALAYVGPGAGMYAIGVFFAIFAGIIVALFGFVWYPIKRLVRMFRKPRNMPEGGDGEDANGEGGATP